MQNVPKYPSTVETVPPQPMSRNTRIVSDSYSWRRDQINPRVWERPDMRRFLAERDIANVYRLLQRYGASQRTIAALTGQAQSDVSEILAGKRRVTSYDLLVRIATGLGVNRGWMGLAYDTNTPDPEAGDQR